jgi:hypothetical protein
MLMMLGYWVKNIIKNKLEKLYYASKELGLEVSTKKTKYIFESRHQTTQNHHRKVGNRSFENVAKLKYLATTVTSQHRIQADWILGILSTM